MSQEEYRPHDPAAMQAAMEEAHKEAAAQFDAMAKQYGSFSAFAGNYLATMKFLSETLVEHPGDHNPLGEQMVLGSQLFVEYVCEKFNISRESVNGAGKGIYEYNKMLGNDIKERLNLDQPFLVVTMPYGKKGDPNV